MQQIITERAQLRGDNKLLKKQLNKFKSMIMRFVLNEKDAMIEYLKEMVWGKRE